VAFVSGGAGGLAATAVTYPLDLCRTTFAATAKSRAGPAGRSLAGFVRHTAATGGSRAFFVGLYPAMVQIVPFMGINFAVYDYFVRGAERREGSDNRGPWALLGSSAAAGTVAGGVSKLAVYPLDTVKKRLQAQTFRPSLPHLRYRGMTDCFIRTAAEEGPRALYRGLLPTIVKSMASTGLTFAIFTGTKAALGGIKLDVAGEH